jgi:hypothetical protein
MDRTEVIEAYEQQSPVYALIGAAAAAERRARGAVSVGARAASVAAWPAEQVWRSPLGAPLRRRASEASAAFEADGIELVRRGRLQAQATFDRTVAAIINHPATEALVASALDDPGLDRLIARVMDSRLIDELTARLLESDEMRLVLDYVTRSPELRAALAHQTAGLADDVAAGMRTRTAVADVAAENFARRLLGRRHRPATE